MSSTQQAELGEPFGVLDRITAIFEAFDEDDFGLGISDLAMRAGLPKSTVSRLVADLVRQRYLERDGKLVHLGIRLFELGQLAEKPQELRYAALQDMADLRSVTGQTVQLAIREGRDMVFVAVMRSRVTPVVASRVGSRILAHSSAIGRAALAHAPAGELAAAMGPSRLEAGRVEAGGDVEEFRRTLAEIRRTGVATDVGGSAPEFASAASPVLDAAGEVVAAIAVTGPADRFDVDRAAPAVRTAALTLRRRLHARGTAAR